MAYKTVPVTVICSEMKCNYSCCDNISTVQTKQKENEQ